MMNLTDNEVRTRINDFMKLRNSQSHRYASYDFCMEYFYNHRGNLIGDNLLESCLQLWSYLGSWGMIARGNALQSKSYYCLKDLIAYIHKHPEHYQISIADNDYVAKVLGLYNDIDQVLSLQNEQRNRKTLVTKIMLGVYGCCPAFDSLFSRALGRHTTGSLNENDVKAVQSFYQAHAELLNSLHYETYSFDDNASNHVAYSIPKMIDMCGFMLENDENV